MKKMSTMQKEMKIRGYSEETIKAYQFHNRAFLKLLNKSPREVTKNDIKYYIGNMIDSGYERATINLAISALKFYYREILSRRFMINRMRSEKKLFDVLSKDEVKRLFESAENIKHRHILMILYYTGVRVSELISIKIKDIDFERMQIHIRCGKGRKDRFITIREELIFLKKYTENISDGSYLFATRNGRYSARSIQRICKKYSEKAKIRKNVTPHTMRRTFATHMIEDDVNLPKVQKLMGHKNFGTTAGYINYASIQV